MNPDLKGKVLKHLSTKAYGNKMDEIAAILDSPTAAETASVTLFFGVTATRDMEIVEALEMDMQRTLMAGHDISWSRPFVRDEDVDITVRVSDVFDRGSNRLCVVETLFATPAGEEIQQQRSTFVLLGGAAA